MYTRFRHDHSLRYSANSFDSRLCLTAIIIRLAYTPSDYFSGDWTFDDILQAMLFQIELNIMTITVLAPNLPVFFQKTSTGGVFFLPGEATHSSPHGTERTNGNSAELNKMRWSHRQNAEVFDGKGADTLTTTVTRTQNSAKERKASFDSDMILMRRSFDVAREEMNGDTSTREGENG